MQEQGYIAKDLCFDEDARQKLINGITSISKAVKSTLGPRGKTVLIESTSHTGGYHTVIYISITVNILSTTAVLIPNHNYVLKIDKM